MSNPPGPEDIRRCQEVLEAIVADRALLAGVPEETSIALFKAAGRACHPTRREAIRLSKELRAKERREAEASDRRVRGAAAIRKARQSAVYVAPPKLEGTVLEPGPELARPRYCYVCKREYRRLHFFYDSMCPVCGDYNYHKRHQSADLKGRTALITGARLKIGYQAALMLLRAGAQVIATTRFPHDAALRYSREPDYAAWSERLKIHGLDLRHSPSVDIFCRYLDSAGDRLDFLINNAAQTVRRPPAFYAHLLEGEASTAGLPAEALPPLAGHERLLGALAASAGRSGPEERVDATGLTVWHAGGPGLGLRESARLSQIKYAYDETDLAAGAFPTGKLDADLQQLDLRAKNSWRLSLGEVPTAEMLELQLINSVAPFILCGKLKGLMLRHRNQDKHIINVSAMEGSFSRGTKTDKHPHTNMAKAALNMLTLTSASDYAKDGIHMNAVDTGWVTDEDPAHHSARKQAEHDFQPPLDIVDGAARVVDPIFSGYITGEHVWGKFLKDYAPTSW